MLKLFLSMSRVIRPLYLPLIVLLGVLLNSCEKEASDKYDILLQKYDGDYTITGMEWMSNSGEVVAVDINGDGVASNDLLSEFEKIGVKLSDSHLIPNYGKRRGKLRAKVPIIDYYQRDDHRVFTVNSPDCFLNFMVASPDSLAFEPFDRLDWPDDERIGLRTFGGVTVVNAYPSHIDLNIERYLVYDYLSSEWVVGIVSVILSRNGNP